MNNIQKNMKDIAWIDINSLKVIDQPMPEHKPYEYENLFNSIEKVGIMNPITVSADMIILDGRTRYSIAKKLQHKFLPCIVVDTDKNPFLNVLKYDLELSRRNLTAREHTLFRKARDEEYQTVESDTFNKLLEQVNPLLRNPLTKMYAKTGDFTLIRTIAETDEDTQKYMIIEKVTDNEELDRIKKDLDEKEYQLLVVRKELTKIKRDYDSTKKQHELLLSGFQNKINEKLNMKIKEIEEQASAKTPEEIRKLVSKETKKIEAEYELERKVLEQNIKELKQKINDKEEELDKVNKTLNSYKEQKEDIDALIARHETKIAEMRQQISALCQTEKLVGHVQEAFLDLNSLYINMTSVGREKFSDNEITVLQDTLNKLEMVVTELKNFAAVGKDSAAA